MLGRTEILFKWLLYAAGVLICWMLHGVALQFLNIFGVMPFIFPMLAAVIAMYEGPFSGSICALVLGVIYDVTIAAPIPCFYTLIFPIIGMLAGLISKNWISMSFWCACLLSLMAFVLTDGFHCLLLALAGSQHAMSTAFSLAFRETGASLPFLIPVYLVFRRIHEICHVYD